MAFKYLASERAFDFLALHTWFKIESVSLFGSAYWRRKSNGTWMFLVFLGGSFQGSYKGSADSYYSLGFHQGFR